MRLAVTWEMCGYVDIPEAKTIEEAMEIFEREEEYFNLPDGEYVDGSFRMTINSPEEMELWCKHVNKPPQLVLE